MSSMTDFLKAIDNKFASIADDGIAAGDIAGYIDTGSYALNALVSGSIYGGLPNNKITLCGAPSSTGKTFIALGCANGFQQNNPKGIVMVFESESAITKGMLVDRGIDPKRAIIIPVTTVEGFRTQALKMVQHYNSLSEKDREPLFFILDSMGMLSTEKELTDVAAGSGTKDMTRAALLKATFRVLTLELGRAGIPLFVTNHVYDAIGQGPYAAQVQGGGTGAVYAASTELRLSKAKEKDADGTVSGVVITVTAHKSRLTRENTKIKCLVKYKGGLDRYYWLTEIAEAAGIFEKVSTKYKVPGYEKPQFGKTIKENPQKYFTKEILDQIEDYVQKNFKYMGTDGEVGIDTLAEIAED